MPFLVRQGFLYPLRWMLVLMLKTSIIFDSDKNKIGILKDQEKPEIQQCGV